MSGLTNPPTLGDKAGVPKPSTGCGGCLVIIGAAILLFLVVTVVSGVNGDDGPREPDPYEAVLMCEKRVEDLLKAPTTAEFNLQATGSNPFTVRGTVDSENGFGAMIRSQVQCTVEIEGEQGLVTVDLLE